MKLSYIPQVKVVHTSSIFHGQVYIPFLNWLLMVGTVAIAAIYNNVRVSNLMECWPNVDLLLDDVSGKRLWVRISYSPHLAATNKYLESVSCSSLCSIHA